MPRVVRTTMNFALDPALGGVETYTLGTADYYKRKFSPASVEVKNIRGSEDDFSLNKQGFQLVKHISSEKDFVDNDHIKKVVYPEVEELLKRTTGATKVQVFSHIVRRHTTDAIEQDIQKNNIADDAIYAEKVPPATFAHIDQGPDSALQILNGILGEQASKLKQSRWGIINTWKPLSPVKRDPLGVCDTRSVADDDLVSVFAVPKSTLGGSTASTAVKSEGQKFQVLHLKENPAQRWHYASDMTPDEALLITIFDTKEAEGQAGVHRRVPHSAFALKDSDDSPARESIEVRSLVFWDEPA
ncbi:hypothetical protein PRZ48_012444 [Zasmidium cellare]|uniref:Uncharacterized protein n=1 Tax=Zasmidium cellare TaxID=395010 RepID=A0ABR0E4W6_ZASCE|nr:hypothetical protein PRZ48_012444 [Zasmidium cellare]